MRMKTLEYHCSPSHPVSLEGGNVEGVSFEAEFFPLFDVELIDLCVIFSVSH